METKHSGEVAVMARCEQIGLTQQETDVLLDLLGWKNRGRRSSAITYESSDDDIAELLRHLMGSDFMAKIEATPETLLSLGFNAAQACWVLRRLKIQSDKIREPSAPAFLAPEQVEELNFSIISMLTHLLQWGYEIERPTLA